MKKYVVLQVPSSFDINLLCNQTIDLNSSVLMIPGQEPMNLSPINKSSIQILDPIENVEDYSVFRKTTVPVSRFALQPKPENVSKDLLRVAEVKCENEFGSPKKKRKKRKKNSTVKSQKKKKKQKLKA
eukprot:snap_masked-scaffold_20-processed-gene-4.41-mRNA-1 protein AED:1.00 eAED:1.00 QI:0/-1/0/0/-1/1/1/0/127